MKKISVVFFIVILVMSVCIYADSTNNNEDIQMVEGEEVIGSVDISLADEEEVGLEIESIEILDKEEYLKEHNVVDSAIIGNSSPITLTTGANAVEKEKNPRELIFIIALLVLVTSSIYIIGSGALNRKEQEMIEQEKIEQEEKENVE